MEFTQKDKYSLDDLLRIMELLRAPGGCPWDREQSHESIRNNFLEEACEAIEAIDTGDTALLKEELGDVLLQVVFHAEMEREAGRFDFSDVADGICKKLIERHPHVFGTVSAVSAKEVLVNWDAIKKRTKSLESQTEVLQSVSKSLPALMRTAKLQHKAQKAGCNPLPSLEAAHTAAESAAKELSDLPRDCPAETRVSAAGRYLFSAAAVVRAAGIEPEEALAKFCDAFIVWFEQWEKAGNV